MPSSGDLDASGGLEFKVNFAIIAHQCCRDCRTPPQNSEKRFFFRLLTMKRERHLIVSQSPQNHTNKRQRMVASRASDDIGMVMDDSTLFHWLKFLRNWTFMLQKTSQTLNPYLGQLRQHQPPRRAMLNLPYRKCHHPHAPLILHTVLQWCSHRPHKPLSRRTSP